MPWEMQKHMTQEMKCQDSKPLLREGNVRNGRRIGVFYWVLFLFACGFEVNGSGCGCGVGVGVCVYLPHPYVR